MEFRIKENCKIRFFEVDTEEAGYEHIEEGSLMIDAIKTEKEDRGKGLADETLGAFIDEYGQKDIYLVCCPAEIGMSFDRLMNFYEDHGFNVDESAGEMPYPLMKR